MAKALIAGIGPEINHIGTYENAYLNGAAGRFSIVSTPAPAQGAYRIKFAGDGTMYRLRCHNTRDVTPGAYVWTAQREFRLSGTLDAGSSPCEFIFFWPAIALAWERVTNTTYKVQARDGTGAGTPLVFTSSTIYTVDTDIAIRLQMDGTNVTMWINGVQEGTAAYTNKPNNAAIFLHARIGAAGGPASGISMYWSGVVVYDGSAESDRGGTTVRRYLQVPNGDPSDPADTAWGTPAGCNNALGSYTQWDDYPGPPDDDTSFNCGDTSMRQLSDMTSPAVTGTILGVMQYGWGRAQDPDKTTNANHLLKSGGSTTSVSGTWAVSSYVPRTAGYGTVPGGGAWTQGVLNGLQAGYDVPAGNGTFLFCSAMGLEVFTIDDDAPPAAVRRRTGVGLGSASPGIY